ncbi:MAG: thioredoxin domain-containing protein [Chloroflexota bacterium]
MSKRQEMREKRSRQERNQRILVIVGVTVIAIAIALLLILPSLKPVGDIANHPKMTRPQVKFNGMGDPNAPVKIIEYSDFQCPYCAKFVTQTEQQLIDAYVATGKVYFEYHSFGEFIGAESARAAEAAYCAGDQEKFWDMHDIIFANQTGENVGAFTDKRLSAFATKLGLDETKFNDCFNNGKYASQVKQDGLDAAKAGVKATPSFLVNGTLVEGAQAFAAFQTEIDALLKK